MITVLSATARPDSMTQRVAAHYTALLDAAGEEHTLLNLQDVPFWERNAAFLDLEQRLLIPARKFIFVMPEYNASFPGSIKTLMDNSDIKQCWWGKKALLTGISDGRAGNLRGLEHMTSILHYLRMDVHHNKLPISRIREEFDLEGRVLKEDTASAIRQQVAQFIHY